MKLEKIAFFCDQKKKKFFILILSKNLIEISQNVSQIQWIFSIIKSTNEDKSLYFLENKEVQKAILRLTEKESSRQNQERKHRFFSFLFKFASNDFLKINENFLKTILIHFTNRFKAPMYQQDISIAECLTCFNLLEEQESLYFGKRKTVLEKAKRAFCKDINGADFVDVKEFIDKFPSVMDEQTQSQVINGATQMIDKWYDKASQSDDSQEIGSFAVSINEIETAFDFDNEKSEKLYERAEEFETEEAEYEQDDDFLSHQKVKKLSDISNSELDEMFRKL